MGTDEGDMRRDDSYRTTANTWSGSRVLAEADAARLAGVTLGNLCTERSAAPQRHGLLSFST